MKDRIHEELAGLKDKLIQLRRDFHQHPELGLEETRTAEVVADHLRRMGLTVKTGVGRTGVVGLLQGKGPGKTLMLRADMDALPLEEENQVPYRSQSPGVMHACGHDGHMAILLAVAEVLSAHRHEIPGRIKFVFQPGEEGFAGARLMIEDGVLQEPAVDAALGLHLTNVLPLGLMAAGCGPVMASMDSFTIKLKGKGAHAAQANLGVDAVVMGSQVVGALQTLASREAPPTTPLVVHVGSVHAGSAFNIVAETAELKGTVRTFDETLRASMPERLNRLVGGIASAMRGSHELDYQFGYPALVNAESMTRLVEEAIVEIMGAQAYAKMPPRMASEDMAFFQQEVPGCFFFVGAANPKKGLDTPNHNPRFDFDEDALVLGAQAMARAAWNFLSANP